VQTNSSKPTYSHYTFNFTATDTLSNFEPYYNATGGTPQHYFLFDSLKVVATGTITDSIRTYNTQIVDISDYYPFGAPMAGRTWSKGNSYRYGFNNQEKDDEIAGKGNINTAEYWEYDTRLGRRWNIDPVFKDNQSPYSAFDNCPILVSDVNGDDGNNPNQDKRVNFIVVPNKKERNDKDLSKSSRKALQQGYKSAKAAAKKNGYVLIEASTVAQVDRQIGKALKNGGKIGTLIFDGHGYYKSPGFQIGNKRVIRENGKFVTKNPYNTKTADNVQSQIESLGKYADRANVEPYTTEVGSLSKIHGFLIELYEGENYLTLYKRNQPTNAVNPNKVINFLTGAGHLSSYI